jgi:uncharacterized repeat protein (TIGR04138 family)
MQEVSFEEALEFIREKDPRFHRDAYLFVREALDHTQKTIGKDSRGRIRHVSGQELLAGIRDYALLQFGPMTMMVLETWGVHTCQDFGEIVFNMVETGGSPAFGVGDIKDLESFAARLCERSDPVAQFLWDRLSEATRLALLTKAHSKAFEAILVKELNAIIARDSIYQAERFAGVTLSDQAKSLLGHDLQGVHLARFNRLLLEEAYPEELVKSHGLLAKTDNDSRADFENGYDFYEAFRTPFLPSSKQHEIPQRGEKPARTPSR